MHYHLTRSLILWNKKKPWFFFQHLTVITCPILPSTDHGVWVSSSTMENATAKFYCQMGYKENSSCRQTTCIGGRWENFQPCTCVIEIPTVPTPSSAHTVSTGRNQPRATPTDNSLLLRSLSNKLQLIWITEISTAFAVVLIALITSLIVCSKFRYDTTFVLFVKF